MRFEPSIFCEIALALLCLSLGLSNAQLDAIRNSKLNLRQRHSLCSKNVSYQSNEPSASNARILSLNLRQCLDLQLPYSTTILPDNVPDLSFKSFEEVNDYLLRWQGFRHLPLCWPYLQIALCSNLRPAIQEDRPTDRLLRISRPSVEICHNVVSKNNCKFIETHSGWPAIFNCSDTNLYARNCTNELRDLKVNSSGATCLYPLTPSNDKSTWFKDISGCSMHCKHPILNQTVQANLSMLIKFLVIIGLASTSLAIILFETNRKSSKSSRIARVTEKCNLCHFINYLGWSVQIFTDSDIGCGPNGTNLYSVPLVANTCVLSFLLTYLPSLAGLIWYAYLGKLCYEKLTGKGKESSTSNEIDGNFNLLTYGVPLAFLITVAFLGQIDGRGLYGICAVGEQSPISKALFVFVPTILCTAYGNIYFLVTVAKLLPFRTRSPSLRRSIIRMLALAILNIAHIVFDIGNDVYEYINRDHWNNGIYDNIVCRISPNSISDADYDPEISGRQECQMGTEPVAMSYYLYVISYLATGIVISSWALCSPNVMGLRRKLVDLLEDEKDRQRRTKVYPYANEGTMVEHGERPGLDLRGLYEKSHELIDMTSPTDPEQVIDPEQLKARRPSDSLGSISLADMTGLDIAAYHHQHKHALTVQGKSARDVINDTRNNQQAYPQTDPLIEQLALLCFQNKDRFKPQNLSACGSEPQFIHGSSERAAF